MRPPLTRVQRLMVAIAVGGFAFGLLNFADQRWPGIRGTTIGIARFLIGMLAIIWVGGRHDP